MELKVEKLESVEAPLEVSDEFVVASIIGAIVGLLIFT